MSELAMSTGGPPSPPPAAAVAVAAAASVQPLTPLRLGLEWFWNPDHLPFVVAERRGLFRKRGLDVHIVEPDEHFEAFDKMRAGELDVAVTETIHLAQDRAKLGPGQIVGFGRFFNTVGGVMFKREIEDLGRGANGNVVRVERPSDLGRLKKFRLTYPGAPGKGGPAIVSTMVENDGGSLAETEIVPVNEGFFHTRALRDGKADVATLIFTNFELPEARAAKLDVAYFDLKCHGVPDFCQLILISTADACLGDAGSGGRKQDFRQLTLALREAADFIKLNASEARQMWYDRFPAKDEPARETMDQILDLTLQMFPASLDLSTEYWRNLVAWLERTEQIEPGTIGDVDFWTNELLF